MVTTLESSKVWAVGAGGGGFSPSEKKGNSRTCHMCDSDNLDY